MSWIWPGDNQSVARIVLGKAREGMIALDTESEDGTGGTLLMVASYHNRVDDIEWLLAAGADLHARDAMGFSALLFAAYNNASEAQKYLIDAGANLNDKNRQGWTALMWTTWWINGPMVKHLLMQGADMNEVVRHRYNFQLTTALSIAEDISWPKAAEMLIAAGVKLDHRDSI